MRRPRIFLAANERKDHKTSHALSLRSIRFFAANDFGRNSSAVFPFDLFVSGYSWVPRAPLVASSTYAVFVNSSIKLCLSVNLGGY